MTRPRRTEAEKIRPFSNGTQYLDWQVSNCGRCKKAATTTQFEAGEIPCEIEKELAFAACDEGTISKEIAGRMGLAKGRYVWQCGEVEWTEKWKKEYRERHEGKKSQKD